MPIIKNEIPILEFDTDQGAGMHTNTHSPYVWMQFSRFRFSTNPT